MNMTFIMRNAEDADALPLSHFMNEIAAEKLDTLVPFDFAFSEDIQRKFITNFRATPNAFLLLGFLNGKIIGAVDLMPHRSTYKKHIGRIGILISKEIRGTGFGRQLYMQALDLARASRLKKIEAEVFTNNTSSIALHLKAGFKIEGHRYNTYQIHDRRYDTIDMSYTL